MIAETTAQITLRRKAITNGLDRQEVARGLACFVAGARMM